MAKNRKKLKRPLKKEMGPYSEKSARASNTAQNPDSFQRHPIRWSFSIFDMKGPFGWSVCSVQILEEVLKPRLSSFETMTWGEIESSGQSHAIQRDRLSKEAQNRLAEIKRDDIDEVFSLRIDGRKRIIGVRDKDIFMFLWWDPQHKVCPSSFGK